MTVAAASLLSLPVSQLRASLSGVAAFQSWVGAADATAALARIYEWEGPRTHEDTRPDKRLAVVGFGQSFAGDRVRVGGAAPYEHAGELILYLRQVGFDPGATSWQAARDLCVEALNNVGAIIDGLERLPHTARPQLRRTRLLEWWRPTVDAEAGESDLFEFLFTLDYTQGT